MAKKVITNIVGSTSRSDLAKLGQGYSLNMFEETTNANENYVAKVLRPIKGYTRVCDIPGVCRGMYTCSNGYDGHPATYAVFGSTLYIIKQDRTAYSIGSLAYGSEPVHFCETGNREGFHSHLVLVDGTYCYAVDTQVQLANQREDFSQIQLPYLDYEQGITIRPSHCTYIYGYVVCNDQGSDSFYVSYQFPFERNDSNNVLDKNIFQVGSEEWGYAGQSLQAYWAPDNTIALVANGSRLYTFGERSYQMFQYTSDVNAPFNSPDTAAYPIGIKAVNSLCQLGSTVAWLGSADIGNNGVYVLAGNSAAKRVSTAEIEREISKMAIVKDAVAQMYQDNQHIFYVITFPSSDVTYCYDLTEDSWSNRCTIDTSNAKHAWRYGHATMNGDGKIWQAYDGGIAEQSDETWTEHDGNPILRLRRGGVMQADYGRFYVDMIEVLTNNGQCESLPDGRQARMMMRFSTDGVTWSDSEVVDIGSAGQYDYDTAFYDFGMANIFNVELSCTDNIPFALYALKVQSSPCQF